MNIAEIEMELSDLVDEEFDRSEFVFKFIEIFNAPKATITKLRNGTNKQADLFGDVFWPRKLYYRPAESGQSAPTIDALKERDFKKNQIPRFIVSTDGAELSALDTKADETLHCDFTHLNDHFDFFLPLAGIDKYEAIEENPADIKAAGRLSKLYDEIIRQNPDWHTPELRHALNQFMTRVLFCFFAEDTGSFEKDLFVKTVSEFGGADGEQLQGLLKQIFQVMNVPEDEREDIPAHIRVFPYVNGGLFYDDTEVPAFSKRAKRLLIEAAGLNWQEINPDIFGSMIQAVVDPSMRGDLGMHYTSVPNIMKVLQPLFLMSLEEDFEKAIGHREERSMLKKLLNRIHKIRVFDPACGSGNFLIIAYRELRKLEMRIFKREEELYGPEFAIRRSGVKLSNFYGIELADFAAETAKLSLWIAEYQMNQQFKDLFGEAPPDFPLKDGGYIHTGNALHLDWFEICPPPTKSVQKEKIFDLATIAPVRATEEVPDDDVETFVCGNPPYQGSKWQTAEQKADLANLFSAITKTFKTLDYVAAWYLKGAQYCVAQNAQCAFVSTNSICQGEQVSLLWPLIFRLGIEIPFAHQSFKWKNLAAKNAGVTCIVVGMRKPSKEPKYLFNGETRRVVSNIGPYLIEMENIIVVKSSLPLNGLAQIQFGNHPYYGSNLILSPKEMDEIAQHYPESRQLMRRLYGSQEIVKGIERWCLWINDEDLPLANSIPPVAERIVRTKEKRLKSDDRLAHELAKKPHQFREMNDSKEHTLVIPRVTSELRPYLQVGLVDGNTAINEQAFAIYDAPIYLFSILSSKLHIIWIKTVCGQLETRIRYSNTLGYNTFPVPSLAEEQKQALENHTWDIIAAREEHPGKTIAWLYDPDTMPDNLLAAHKALDDTLEKIYIGRPFKNDTERLEHLFMLYAEITAKEEAGGEQ